MERLPIVSVACIAPLIDALLASKQENKSLSLPESVITAWFESASNHRSNEIVATSKNIMSACRDMGFLYIKDYHIPAALEHSLDQHSRAFFLLPEEEKQRISMQCGGLAWRGFFPVGGELTSGKPDVKEGLYFGQERTASDIRVQQKTPLFGLNLFPERPRELRDVVLSYMDHCEALGQCLLVLIAIGLGLKPTYFISAFCHDPTCLFRVFHYPPPQTLPDVALHDATLWGVGEHTDYGLVTLLKQDSVGGLEVQRVDGTWITAPPVPHTLVVNIGDMMEAMTGGLFTSTPHRVRNTGGPDAMRLSFPFFFDPGFHSKVNVLPLSPELQEEARTSIASRASSRRSRWDNGQVTVKVEGTYGEYLMAKVGKVFPDLAVANSMGSKL